MSENMSERRVSRRANKGKPPKRFSYSSSTSSRSSQRQASREVELLEAELRTQEEVAKLEQKKLEVSLDLARKRLLLEKSRDFRRGEQSESSSDSSSEDEEFFDTVTGLESQLSSTSYSRGVRRNWLRGGGGGLRQISNGTPIKNIPRHRTASGFTLPHSLGGSAKLS